MNKVVFEDETIQRSKLSKIDWNKTSKKVFLGRIEIFQTKGYFKNVAVADMAINENSVFTMLTREVDLFLALTELTIYLRVILIRKRRIIYNVNVKKVLDI